LRETKEQGIMVKNCNKNGIALELKLKILAESMEEGAVIALIAKKYNTNSKFIDYK
jgi:hypothetical protein